jgi:hypothetical protein
VLDFLGHLEAHRGNSVRTRNARLAAIHYSFALFSKGLVMIGLYLQIG